MNASEPLASRWRRRGRRTTVSNTSHHGRQPITVIGSARYTHVAGPASYSPWVHVYITQYVYVSCVILIQKLSKLPLLSSSTVATGASAACTSPLLPRRPPFPFLLPPPPHNHRGGGGVGIVLVYCFISLQ